MNLLVVVIALVLRYRGLLGEPAATVGHLVRRWRDMWLQRGAREGWAPPLVLGLAVLLPALLLAVFLNLFDGLWQRLIIGAVGVLVLGQILLDQRQPGVAKRMQAEWIARVWPGDNGGQPALLAAELVADAELAPARRELVEEHLRELFAPLFWFLLLGPVGALVYYLLRLMAEGEGSPAVPVAQQMLHYAEWPVARLLALGFALTGDFMATWQHLRDRLLDRQLDAVELLDESAERAQVVSLIMSPDSSPAAVLTHALATVQALLHRTLILLVVLLALHTLLWF